MPSTARRVAAHGPAHADRERSSPARTSRARAAPAAWPAESCRASRRCGGQREGSSPRPRASPRLREATRRRAGACRGPRLDLAFRSSARGSTLSRGFSVRPSFPAPQLSLCSALSADGGRVAPDGRKTSGDAPGGSGHVASASTAIDDARGAAALERCSRPGLLRGYPTRPIHLDRGPLVAESSLPTRARTTAPAAFSPRSRLPHAAASGKKGRLRLDAAELAYSLGLEDAALPGSSSGRPPRATSRTSDAAEDRANVSTPEPLATSPRAWDGEVRPLRTEAIRQRLVAVRTARPRPPSMTGLTY